MITLDTIFRSIVNCRNAQGKPTLTQDDMVKNFRSLQQIIPKPPEDPAYKILYHFLFNYLKKCDGGGSLELPSYEYLKKYFEEKEGNEAVLAALERIIQERPCEGEEFRAILREYRDDQNLDDFEKILTDVNKIARLGLEINNGKKKSKLQGIESAIGFFAQKSRDLRKTLTKITTESQIVSRNAINEAKEKYKQKETTPDGVLGIQTGIYGIDRYSYGLGRGQFMIVGAFTEHGKTTFCLNMAYQAIICGWNTAFISLEMSHDEIKEKIYTLHTCNPKFRDKYPHLKHVSGKVDINNVANGLLSPDEKELYFKALDDLGEGENEAYGNFYLWQPESTITTISDIEFKLLDIQQQFKANDRDLDFVVIDYLSLLGIDRTDKTNDHNQDLNNTIKATKRLCLTFNNGKGVALLSPFQISRGAFKEASKNEGKYDSTALSNAHEAERSADIVLTLWVDEEMRNSGVTRIQNLKNRRNRHFPATTANVNKMSGFITDHINISETDPVKVVGEMYGI